MRLPHFTGLFAGILCHGLWMMSVVAQDPAIALVPRTSVWTPGFEATPAMAFDDRTGKLATGHNDGNVRWWTEQGQATDAPWPKAEGAVTVLAIGPRGQRLALATSAAVEIYEQEAKKLIAKIPVTEPVKGLVFSHKEELLAIGSDNQCRIVNATNGTVEHTASVVAPYKTAVFVDNDRTLIIADKENQHQSVFLKNFKSNRTGFHLSSGQGKKARFQPITALAVSADQRALAVVLPPGRLLLQGEGRAAWNERQILTIKNWIYLQVQLSPDGRYALTTMSATPRAVPKGYIWDLVSKRQTATLENVPQQIQTIAYAPKHSLVALRSQEGEVSLWNLKTAFHSPSPPTTLFEDAVVLGNPSDPDAPVTHKDVLVERTEVPNAPPYLKADVWKASPFRTTTNNVYLSKVLRDSTCLFVYPRPTSPADLERYMGVIAFHTEKDGWHNLGPCPWRPDATLLCQPVSADRGNLPVGSLPLSHPGTQLLIVGNQKILEPQYLQQFSLTARRELTTRYVRHLFKAKRFSEIEKLAVAARNKGETLRWGYPELNAIYAGLESTRYSLPAADCHELAEAWLKEQPQSLTARYVLARSLISLGWGYRGTGFAQTVTDENFAKFNKHLEDARRMLTQNSTKFAKDPALEQALLAALPGGKLSASATSDLILKGLKKNPANLSMVSAGTAFLLPRWTDEPRAAVELTERIRRQHPGDIGKALCARVALDIFSFEPERWQDLYEFDAQQFEQDWDAYYRLQPNDHFQTTRACQVLGMYGSLAKAQAAWQQLGLNADPEAAGGVPEYLEWNDRLQDTKHPALIWSRLGKGNGLLMLTPDGEHMMTISQVGRMNFLKTADGELVGQDLSKFFFLMDGVLPQQGLVILATEGGILHYDNNKGVRRVAYPAGVQSVRAKFTPNGKRLVIVDVNASTHILNPETGESIAMLPPIVPPKGPGAAIGMDIPAEFAVSADQQIVAVAASRDPVRLIQLSDGKLLSTFPEEAQASIGSLYFNASGQQLWLARGEKVSIWDVATRSLAGELPPIERIPANLIATPDDRYLAIVQNAHPRYDSAKITILDRQSSPAQWRKLPEMRAGARLAWHPTKPWLVTYSHSGIVRVWDLSKF